MLRTVILQLTPHRYALQYTRCNTHCITHTAAHTATHCNTHCNSQQQTFHRPPRAAHRLSATNAALLRPATHTLQHTLQHALVLALERTATHTAPHSNNAFKAAMYCALSFRNSVCCSVLQVLQCVCNTLRHHVLRTVFPQLMPHCYALQHTRCNTHCNMQQQQLFQRSPCAAHCLSATHAAMLRQRFPFR